MQPLGSSQGQHEQQQRHPGHQQQRRGTYSDSPWQFIQNSAVAKMAHDAFAPQHSTQQRAVLLQDAFGALLQHLPDIPPTDIAALLHCIELAGTAVPFTAMQQLLRHMDSSAQLYDVRTIMRVLRSASFVKLGAASSSSSRLQADKLLQRIWQLTEASHEPLRPSSVPQLLRCVSVLQNKQQRLSDALLDNFVRHWLEGCALNAADDSSSSSQLQVAQQAAMVIKAIHSLGMQLDAPALQQLLAPVQAMAQDSLVSSSSNSTVSAQGAVDAAAWVQPLLLAAHHLDRRGALAEQQRAQSLQMASRTLQGLAAAAAGLNSSGGGGGGDALPAAISGSIVEVTKSLSTVQRASPISKVPGLVDSLAGAMLGAHAPFGQLAAFLASLAGLNLSPSLGVMADLTAAACAQLQQQRRQRRQGEERVSWFLWASAAMGYSLGQAELQVLLQHKLSNLKAPATQHVAQALWALAHMGPNQQQQQQQQELWGSGLGSDVAELACRLLSRVLAEQRSAAAGSSSSAAAASSGSSSTWAEQGMGGHVAWQLSVCAWAAAMCDLTASKNTVLQLCSFLARPKMWAALREAELGQVLFVHLWLSGHYQWSNSSGLASVLNPEQMQQLRAARLAQTQKAFPGHTHLGVPRVDLGRRYDELLQLDLQQLQACSPNSSSSSSPTGPTSSSSSGNSMPSPNGAAVSKGSALGTSVAQVGVWKAVKQVSGVQCAQLEAPTHDQLFNVDVLVQTTAGERIALEFDGPYHYAIVVPSAAAGEGGESGSVAKQQQQQQQQQQQRAVKGRAAVRELLPTAMPQQQRQQQQQQQEEEKEEEEQQQPQQGLAPQLVPVRRVLFRNKCLAARGMRVVCVPYFEWMNYTSKPRRRQYLQRLISKPRT
jgi:hypothetical protein